jgi:multiple sugar transport system substrate-binding protein
MKRTTTAGLRTIAVLGVAALVLAGCGRDADTESGPGQSAAIDDSPATGTIDVWAMGTEGEELDGFVDDFREANPDAEVKVTAIPWEAAHQKIASAISSGNTPDVSLVGTTWMGEFAETGGLEPTPEGLVDEADFFEGAWDSTVVNDTAYGTPWYVETRVLYYRKDLAEKAGWSEAPKTWDELKTFAKDLQDKAGVEYGINLQPGQTGSWQSVLPFAWTNGAEVTNDDGTQYTIDSPEMTEALDYYKSFFDEGLAGPTRLLDPGELESGFAEDEFGAFISGPWHTGLVEDAGVSPDEYDVAPLPGKESAPGTSFVGGGDLAVFADSDNKESAWKLVRWLSEPDVQQDWYTAMGSLPSVKSSWESGKFADDPKLAVFGTQLETTEAPPAVPTWEQVAATIDSDIEQAIKGATPTSEAVDHMQSQAESIGTGL